MFPMHVTIAKNLFHCQSMKSFFSTFHYTTRVQHCLYKTISLSQHSPHLHSLQLPLFKLITSSLLSNMAPLLNSKTVAVLVELEENFRLRLRPVPSVVKDIAAAFCGLFITLSLGLAIVAFVVLLTSDLTPHFPNVQIDSVTVTVTPPNTSAVISTSTFYISFVFHNPNHKIRVTYKSLEAKIWFGNDDLTLASTSLPPFSHGGENATRIETQLTVYHVADGMGVEMGHGSMNFGVSLLGWVRFEHGVMRSRVVRLKIECGHVLVVFPKGGNWNGTLVGPSYCE